MEHRLHLSTDKKFQSILETQGGIILQKRNKVYLRLCSSILSQQLSTKVASILYQRFLNLYEGKEPSAQQILNTPVQVFRGIGFSNSKAQYVHNVCQFFLENKITDAQLHKMSNEKVIDLLTQIKGVGKWTVEMILMFTLAREDVFALDDLGLNQSVCRLYKIKETDKKLLRKKIEKISLKWKPYRTYASMYLWRWADNP